LTGNLSRKLAQNEDRDAVPKLGTLRRLLCSSTSSEVSLKFHVTLQKDPQGGYVVRCLELPGALSQGETENEALANIRDAILTVLEMMREQGEPVPTQPAEVRELVVA
jgi:predicted RNase H-like HicB family nuclease